jgi:hypothetical protein
VARAANATVIRFVIEYFPRQFDFRMGGLAAFTGGATPAAGLPDRKTLLK